MVVFFVQLATSVLILGVNLYPSDPRFAALCLVASEDSKRAGVVLETPIRPYGPKTNPRRASCLPVRFDGC